MKQLVQIVRVVFMLAIVAFVGSANADSKTVRIGAVASVSGPAAEQGKHWLDGAKLAVSDLKTEGVNVELIVEDDGTTCA